MTKMTINITKDVLYKSRNCKKESLIKDKIGQNCAIGIAIFDLFGDLSWVCSERIIINKKGFNTIFATCREEDLDLGYHADYQIALPYEAKVFITKFDNSAPEERINMTPFSFDIDIPDEVIELVGGVEEVYKILEESKTMQLVG